VLSVYNITSVLQCIFHVKQEPEEARKQTAREFEMQGWLAIIWGRRPHFLWRLWA